jgi:hypothetical protein
MESLKALTTLRPSSSTFVNVSENQTNLLIERKGGTFISQNKTSYQGFRYLLPLAWKKFAGVLGGKNSLFLNFLLI